MQPNFQIQITTRQTSSKASDSESTETRLSKMRACKFSLDFCARILVEMSLLAMISKFSNYVLKVNLCVNLRRRPPTALRR